MIWCVFGVLHVAPDFRFSDLNLVAQTTASRHHGIESNLLLVDDFLPHFLSVIWVTFLWFFFFFTFWPSFSAGWGPATRSGDSARPGRVLAFPCSPPEPCRLKEERIERINLEYYKYTGWHITLAKTSRWLKNKSSGLAWPGLAWPGKAKAELLFWSQREVLGNVMCHPVFVQMKIK